jgi:hypothetical protein
MDRYGVRWTITDRSTQSRRTMLDEKSYTCADFYPLAANNLTHAAFLFAIWRGRRKFGPSARCIRLDVQAELADGATFEADLIRGSERELYRFTVLSSQSSNSQ